MSLGSFASPSCVIYPLSIWRWLRRLEVEISADDTWFFHFLYSKKSSNQVNPYIAIFQKSNLYKQDWAEPADLSEPVWKQHQRYRVAIEERHQGPGAHHWWAERDRTGLRISSLERSQISLICAHFLNCSFSMESKQVLLALISLS